MNTVALARGRWRDILYNLGIDQSHLTGKHCSCPLCGGKDRFRFDDKNGDGTYFCTCGSGYGMCLLMKFREWNFKQAANEVDKIMKNCREQPIQAKQDPMIRITKTLTGLQTITNDDPVSSYLQSREIIDLNFNDIKYHPGLAYYIDGELVSTVPAMVAAVRNKAGKIITLHCTYIQCTNNQYKVLDRKILPPTEKIVGSTIRLAPPDGSIIGIAEGIETAMSAMILHNTPCIAAINANNLEAYTPPENVKQVRIFADKDKSFTGQKSAFLLAHKLVLKGISAEVVMPPNMGSDFNDELKMMMATR